jgi:hypothetical protein
MKMTSSLSILAILGLAALAPVAAHAQTVWKLASGYSENTFQTVNLKQFARDVATATGGRLVSWQFWIDRGGTFTDIVARAARRRARHAQAAVGKPRALPRRRRRRHPRPARHRAGPSRSGRS